ncbi:hypothetical protein [Aliarcobacter cryaerophilus]|uniref:hypothetical protein n=1 Tax=Aliarcobacter cryaerophilus TaxID=28198 RepID=UPI0013FD9EDE|nr:hypothetical protein [Aliarcobacter cryaerophilus]
MGLFSTLALQDFALSCPIKKKLESNSIYGFGYGILENVTLILFLVKNKNFIAKKR